MPEKKTSPNQDSHFKIATFWLNSWYILVSILYPIPPPPKKKKDDTYRTRVCSNIKG
jgi:hypothetical protein